MTPRLAMTVREAAAALGVGRDAVYNAINRGELRAVRFGGTLLVPRLELERMLGMDTREPIAVTEVARELLRVLEDRAQHSNDEADGRYAGEGGRGTGAHPDQVLI